MAPAYCFGLIALKATEQKQHLLCVQIPGSYGYAGISTFTVVSCDKAVCLQMRIGLFVLLYV